jgi:hypothetical protein
MALSDEDRAAIRELREHLEGKNPFIPSEKWERVLKLAGEEPEEPANGTFWLDPDENNLWIRDDLAGGYDDPVDLGRWWGTGRPAEFSWIQVHRSAPNLVELVRKDTLAAQGSAILSELFGTWEAIHHEKCGRGLLSTCSYPGCQGRWRQLVAWGCDTTWEQY